MRRAGTHEGVRGLAMCAAAVVCLTATGCHHAGPTVAGLASPSASSPTSAATASAVASSPPASSPTVTGPTVVPWADLSYRSPVRADGRPPQGQLAWCRAGQLTVVPDGLLGPGAGELFLAFRVSARPGVRCTLQGWPAVQISAADQEWTIAAARDTFAVPPGGILDAHHPATFQLNWTTYYAEQLCAFRDVTDRLVRVTLPHAGGTATTTDHRVLVRCGIVRHGGKPRPPLVGVGSTPFLVNDSTFYAGPYLADLSVSIIAPQTVRAGAVLSYNVLIQANRGGAVFTGNACFGYRETLGLVTTTVHEPVLRREQHELNCAQAPRSDNGGGLEFAMRIRVPTTVHPGSMLDLLWQSDAGSRGGFNESDAGINIVP
jgi:Protein of unknown function (DUF4232)